MIEEFGSTEALPAEKLCDHLISPLEAMVRASWSHNNDQNPYDDLSDFLKSELTDEMRAALLALAECELPEEVIEEGAEAYSDAVTEAKEADQATIIRLKLSRKAGAALCQTLPPTFSAMLRAIASPPPSGDRTALTP